MKKIIIVLALIILISIIAGIKESKINNSCDFVIGVSTFHHEFDIDKDLYGYKDGELFKIKGKYKRDKSNFNYVFGTEELVTYLDYDRFMKLLDEMNGTSSADYKGMTIDTYVNGHEKTFEKYYNNYIYDSKDKNVFDNMINDLIKKHETEDSYYSAIYFFVKDNNYYLWVYSDKEYIMYEYKNKTLNKLFGFNGNISIEYFK